MKKIAFAGSFDPITKGHLWVVEQGLNIADEVIILIAKNDKKTPLFSNSEKKEMILSSVKEMFPDNSHRITTETVFKNLVKSIQKPKKVERIDLGLSHG